MLRLSWRFSAWYLGFFFLRLTDWIREHFGTPKLEQILYHAWFGSEGLLRVDPRLVSSFVRQCLAEPLWTAAALVAAEQLLRVLRARGAIPVPAWMGTLLPMLGGLLVSGLHRLGTSKLPLVFLLACGLSWAHGVSGFAFAASYFGPDYFSRHHVPAGEVPLRQGRPKNLVLIYVESLETTYADEALFGTDLLADLRALGGTSFARYRQAPGTNWTIAAIAATQCGVPLKVVTLQSPNFQGEALRSFMPGATCLGDILAAHGYRNVFLGGADLIFAGKGKFFRDHGYAEVLGRTEWVERGKDPDDLHAWGLYDHDLLAEARRKLLELRAGSQPFNLTVLTVDTHHPDGFYSPKCAHLGPDRFENIVRCNASQVAEFVRFIRDSGHLEDTNVVVVGDHLAMRNRVWGKLTSVPDRFIFNTFLSSEPPSKNREEILPFDLFPTLVEFTGMEVAGDRLGLGISAFGSSAVVPAPRRLAEMEESLLNHSASYIRLWDRGD